MKTLFRKELRENLKVAVPACVLLTGLIMFAAKDGAGPVERGLLIPIGMICAAFAASMGWLQIHNEQPRDLWAFLVHRPITRTEIFFAKVAAGLALYILATGLPLAGYIAWARTPGHIAAPFEWAMVLPLAGILLLGFVWYFAGLLTSLRQARWYASRALGLVAAFPVHAAAMLLTGMLTFWQFHAAILLVATLLAMAVWGGFQSDGHYAGQPVLGKLATAIVLTLGSTVLVFAVLAAVNALMLRDDSDSFYAVTKDGAVYRVTTRGAMPASIVDLNGVPLKDPKTGHEMDWQEFEKVICARQHVIRDFSPSSQLGVNWQEPSDQFYRRWRQADGIIWYWTRRGRLVGYDGLTRRFVASLGPNLLANGPGAPEERFLRPQIPEDRMTTPRTLATSTAVYQLDLPNRTNRILFATSENDRIGGAKDVSEQAAVVVSRQFVRLVTAEGRLVWEVPYEPRYVDTRQIDVFLLGVSNQYALWIYPSHLVNGKLASKVGSQMVWVSSEQGLLKRTELPPPDRADPLADTLDKVLSFLVPPEFPFIKPLFFKLVLDNVPIQWNLVRLALAGGAISALIGWLLGQRYNFSARAQLGWVMFHLLSGFPGLLAFVSVQEWPARKPCPACKQLRTVDRERCEHCEAAFAPPTKEGTELFEPLGAEFRI